MTKSQLNQVTESPTTTKATSSTTTGLEGCAVRQTCDVDGIIAGLDYETFVLLPGTMNARPGMKFADETVEEPDDSADAQYFDFPSFGENAMGMQSMYFIQNPPPQYWATQFVLASPPLLDGKKSKKKNKKKRNKNKQRQQRLEREAQAAQKGQPLVGEDTSPETSPRLSPLKKVSKQQNIATRKPTLQTLNFTPKTPISGDKKAAKKKRNKQRRRGKQLSVPPVLTFSPGSGRARRASHPGHLYEAGVDMMSLHFGGLSVNQHESGLPGSPGTFPKSGLTYPLRSPHPAKQRHYMSNPPLLPRGPPLWAHHPIPLYGQAC